MVGALQGREQCKKGDRNRHSCFRGKKREIYLFECRWKELKEKEILAFDLDEFGWGDNMEKKSSEMRKAQITGGATYMAPFQRSGQRNRHQAALDKMSFRVPFAISR